MFRKRGLLVIVLFIILSFSVSAGSCKQVEAGSSVWSYDGWDSISDTTGPNNKINFMGYVEEPRGESNPTWDSCEDLTTLKERYCKYEGWGDFSMKTKTWDCTTIFSHCYRGICTSCEGDSGNKDESGNVVHTGLFEITIDSNNVCCGLNDDWCLDDTISGSVGDDQWLLAQKTPSTCEEITNIKQSYDNLGGEKEMIFLDNKPGFEHFFFENDACHIYKAETYVFADSSQSLTVEINTSEFYEFYVFNHATGELVFSKDDEGYSSNTVNFNEGASRIEVYGHDLEDDGFLEFKLSSFPFFRQVAKVTEFEKEVENGCNNEIDDDADNVIDMADNNNDCETFCRNNPPRTLNIIDAYLYGVFEHYNLPSALDGRDGCCGDDTACSNKYFSCQELFDQTNTCPSNSNCDSFPGTCSGPTFCTGTESIDVSPWFVCSSEINCGDLGETDCETEQDIISGAKPCSWISSSCEGSIINCFDLNQNSCSDLSDVCSLNLFNDHTFFDDTNKFFCFNDYDSANGGIAFEPANWTWWNAEKNSFVIHTIG